MPTIRISSCALSCSTLAVAAGAMLCITAAAGADIIRTPVIARTGVYPWSTPSPLSSVSAVMGTGIEGGTVFTGYIATSPPFVGASDTYYLFAADAGGQAAYTIRGNQQGLIPGDSAAQVQQLTALRCVASNGLPSTVYGRLLLQPGTGAVTSANAEVVYRATTFNVEFQILARSGSGNVPGVLGASFRALGDPAANGGHAAFTAYLQQAGGVNASNDQGCWATDIAGQLQLVARGGQAAPGAPGKSLANPFIFQAPMLTQEGDLTFLAQFTGGGQGIYTKPLAGATTLKIKSGDSAPGVAGAVIESINDIQRAGGWIGFRGTMAVGPGGVTSANQIGLWLIAPNGSVSLVARQGDPFPAVAGAAYQYPGDSFLGLHVNRNGDYTFATTIQGPGIDSTNNTVIMRSSPTGPTLVARKGSQLQGGFVRFLTSMDRPTINLAGQVVFEAVVSGQGIDASNNQWFFEHHPEYTIGLTALARSGDQIEVSPGDFRTISHMTVSPGDGTDQGNGGSLTDSGILGARVDFTDGTSAVVNLGVPQPENEYANDQRASAAPITIGNGSMVRGICVGADPGSPGAFTPDYLRLTGPRRPGITRYRLNYSVAGGQMHTVSLQGNSQNGGVIDPASDVSVQGMLATSATTGIMQWYGLGTGESSVVARLTGTLQSSFPYNLQVETAPITPGYLGVYRSGDITITCDPSGTASDTELWIYDSNFNAIPGAGDDDVAGSTRSSLRRTLGNGVYYVAASSYSMSNNQASPPDDAFRNGAVLDAPNTLLCSSPSTGQTFHLSATDGMNTQSSSAVTTEPFQVHFFQLNIYTPPCSLADIVSIGGLPPADGILTGDDFNTFIAAFATGDPLADVVSIGGTPPGDGLVTGDDFNAFIAAFAAGCP